MVAMRIVNEGPDRVREVVLGILVLAVLYHLSFQRLKDDCDRRRGVFIQGAYGAQCVQGVKEGK